MPKYILRWLLLFLFVINFIACQRTETCGLPPEENGPNFPDVTDGLAVDIYLDATPSMKGFIVPGTSTSYQQTLPLLESAAERGWSNGNTSFYKFGSQTSELPGRQYLNALKPDFYGATEFNTRTYIERVIQAAKADALTIIVTDLFQDNADINVLSKSLKEKYVTRNLAIGVVGIRSEFGGKVYDVGVNNYAFDYRSNGADVATFRPFYLLMLGGHADIARYIDMLEAGEFGLLPAKNFIIFSSHVTEHVTTFEGGKINSVNNLVQVGNLVPSGKADGRPKQFRLHDSNKPSSFTATLKYMPLPYTLTSTPESLVPEVSAWKCQGGGALAANDAAAHGFTIKSATLSGTNLKVEAEVASRSLPGDGTYCFKVVLRPQDLSLPSWVNEWNMDARKIEEWKQQPAGFNGASTFNLSSFLGNLAGLVKQVHRPKISEFYCYVQKG